MLVKITEEMKNTYLKIYKETYSVSEIMRRSKDGVGRGRIVNILKKEGIYEGLNGPNYIKKKVENHEKIMMEKYGVINWGQMKDAGYKKQNKIPYKNVSYLTDDYKNYREHVDKLTKLNIKKYYDKNVPKYCYYTGIKFADEEGPVNPNDPRKRSIDHKTPVIHCFLTGVSVEEASSLDNVVFVLKYVNSIKAQSTEESILPIAKEIRKAFLDEGFSSKENFKT